MKKIFLIGLSFLFPAFSYAAGGFTFTASSITTYGVLPISSVTVESVTDSAIAFGITPSKIADGSLGVNVMASSLAVNSVWNSNLAEKIASSNIASGQLGSAVIISSIATGSVYSGAIAGMLDGSVVSANFGSQDITTTGNLSVATFRMTTGAGSNKILTTDDTGNGSWQALVPEVRDVFVGSPGQTEIDTSQEFPGLDVLASAMGLKVYVNGLLIDYTSYTIINDTRFDFNTPLSGGEDIQVIYGYYSPVGTAGGGLSGSYPNPTIAAQTLGSGVIISSIAVNAVYPKALQSGNYGINITGLATTATNLAGGGAGRIPYQTTNGATDFTAGAGALGYVLTGANAGAPTWTSATNASTANTIVKRDASKNFMAGTITAALSGNATTATTATTATNITSGSIGYIPYQHASGSTYMLAAGSASYVLSGNGAAAPVWTQATNANMANTIVKRDASGNFSAGTITASSLRTTSNITVQDGSTIIYYCLGGTNDGIFCRGNSCSAGCAGGSWTDSGLRIP